MKIIYLTSILFLALVIRLINLTSLPIFTDEAIYIRWTQIANGDPAWRFISLTDGKQPLFIWMSMVSQRIFADPLFAGRFVSVITGVFTCIGLFLVAKQLFSTIVGLLTALIWAILPFSVWHDRLAMMDSTLVLFCVFSLWLQIKLIKKTTTDIAIILGIVMGLGLLTKSSAQFFLFLFPFSLLLVKLPLSRKYITRWILFASLSLIFAIIINSVQRLSPFFYIVGQKNLTFIYSFSEFKGFSLIRHWQIFWGNLYSLSNWTITYITFPFIFLLLFSVYKIREKTKEKLLLLVWFIFPFLGLAFFGKVIYPRFVLFMAIPITILIADGLNSLLLLKKIPKILIYLIFFSYPLYFDSQIIFNVINTPLPWVDRGQYIDDWPAGWGIKEVVAYLDQQSINNEICLITEGTFGLTPYSLEIYLGKNKNIEIIPFWPISDGIKLMKEKASIKTTYLLLKDTQNPDSEWNVELIQKYKRGKGNNYLGLYQVRTQ